jgi:hypothetical protein
MKVLAVLMIAAGLLAGCAFPRRAVNMIRRRPSRKFCPRCKRLMPPGMVPQANSVCMPDDWSVCGGIAEKTAQKLRRILWGTESTPRWVWSLFGFGPAALLLTGCATMQAYQAGLGLAVRVERHVSVFIETPSTQLNFPHWISAIALPSTPRRIPG